MNPYRIMYYNSQTKQWRKGRTFKTMRKAAETAREYFILIQKDGIFGEADKLCLTINDSDWPTYVWRKDRWVKL